MQLVFGMFEDAPKPPKNQNGTPGKSITGSNFKPGQWDLAKGKKEDKTPQGWEDHEPDKGWFRVIDWMLFLQRPVDAEQNTTSGDINHGELRIIKHFGRLTPLTMQAFSMQQYFKLTIDFTDPQKQGQTVQQLVLENAQIYRVRHYVGAPGFTTDTTLGSMTNDTKEYEELSIVFRKLTVGEKGKGRELVRSA